MKVLKLRMCVNKISIFEEGEVNSHSDIAANFLVFKLPKTNFCIFEKSCNDNKGLHIKNTEI